MIERFEDIQWWKNALIDMIIFFVKINPFNQIIEGFNVVLRYLKKTEIPNPFDNLTDALKGLKKPTKEYEHEFGSLADSIKDGMKTVFQVVVVLKKLLRILKKLTKQYSEDLE